MNARTLGAVVLLAGLVLERFAAYGFRAQFSAVLVERGVSRVDALRQYGEFAEAQSVLPILFAGLAIALPRVWLALLGTLVALFGYVLATFGSFEEFATGVTGLAVGVSLLRATLVCAAADFVDVPRDRLVVGVLGYGCMNLGASMAPITIVAATPGHFSELPAHAAMLAALCCAFAFGLQRALPRKSVGTEPLPKGLVGIGLLIAPLAFLWLMFESQPMDLDLPWWAHWLNTLVIVPVSFVVALVFRCAPAHMLSRAIIGLLVVGLGLCGAGAVGLNQRDSAVWVGLQAVLTFAEIGLALVVFALAVASLPQRFAPVAVAIVGASPRIASALAGRPEWQTTALGVLGFVSFVTVAMFAVLSPLTLGMLGQSESPQISDDVSKARTTG